MSAPRIGTKVAVLAFVLACSASLVVAEDVEKKFRFGLGLGFINQQGELKSNSANSLLLVDANQSSVDFYRDPRNDSSVFGSLEVKPGEAAAIFGQYAVNKIFMVELMAGYQRTQMGDVEVQAQFAGIYVPDTQRFLFEPFQIEAGDVEQVPIQLTFFARFRPRARFNPYLGGGFGYTFFSYEPSDEMNQLSFNLDNSQGAPWAVTSAFFGTETITDINAPVRDYSGASVDIKGNWEWHVAGGFEYSFKRKWAVFLDLRYIFASRNATVQFDGQDEIGLSVPQLTDYCANLPTQAPPPGAGPGFTGCPGSVPGAQALNGEFGPVFFTRGGLIDGGQILPKSQVPPDLFQYCDPNPQATVCFVPVPDGKVDPGFYYVQGGSFSLDAFSALAGVKYTF